MMVAEENKSKPGHEQLEEARDHMRAAHEAMHKSMEKLMPEGFTEERKTARKEFLLAMRSLVDAALEKTSGTPKS
jgi:hypothetical protein